LKIGFDIDGVLGTQNQIDISCAKDDPDLEKLYYATVKPQFHPGIFMAEDDEGYLITARKEDLWDITVRWCKKYFPQYQLIQVPVKPWVTARERGEWRGIIAEAKSTVINHLKLDVYFEDMPETVQRLRKLCSNTKIIQFGGELDGSFPV
jgi:hypothetical protein